MRLFGLLILLILGAFSFGDGIAFTRGIEPPSIPFQRAFIGFDGKTETLIVSSTIQVGGASDVVWVVPVPSAPKRMAPVRENVFEPLEAITVPRFVKPPTESDWSRVWVIGVGFLIFLVIAPFLFQEKHGALARFFKGLIAFSIAITVFAFVFFPDKETHKGTAGSAEPPSEGVRILETNRIGNYEVQVVQGTKNGALADWLRAEGIDLPKAANDPVESYVRDGWSFVVAKLKATAKGNLSPHPLKLVFDTPKLVYPMRLTGAMGKDVEVELFVAGMGTASSPQAPSVTTGSLTRELGRMPWAKAMTSSQIDALSHADLVDSVLPGQLITRLRKSARPADMREDWTFEVSNGSPSYERTDTKDSARLKALRRSFLFSTLTLIVFVTILIARSMRPIWTMGAALIAAGIGYFVWTDSLNRNPGFEPEEDRYIGSIDQQYGNVTPILGDLAPPDMAKLESIGSMSKYLGREANVEPLRFKGKESDLPDEKFMIAPMEGGIRVVVKDYYGARYEFKFPGIKP